MTQPVSNVRVRRTQKLLRKGLPVDVFQSSQDFPHLLAGVPRDATEGIEPIHLTTLLTRSDLSTTATARGCRLLLGASLASGLTGLAFLHLVMLTNGFRYPFADPTSHELGAICLSHWY